MELTLRWVIGLLFAVVLGHFIVEPSLQLLRKRMGLNPAQVAGRVPRWLTGCVERLFFAFFIAFQVGGAGTAMIGWLAVKMAANWGRPPPRSEEEKFSERTNYAFSALLAGLVSMFFALVGGLIAGGEIWPS